MNLNLASSTDQRYIEYQNGLDPPDQARKLQAEVIKKLNETIKMQGIDISSTLFDLDEFAIELGIYFVFLCLCMFLLLNQVGGDPRALKRYFLFRKLEIFPHAARNTERVANMLLLSGIYYIIAPFLVLLGWFILILFDRSQENESTIPAWATLIVGIAFIIFGFNVMALIWNRYYFSMTNAILSAVFVILLTLYQSLVIFGYENQEKFLPYSAIFLCFNVLFMSMIVFLDNYEDFQDVLDLIKLYFKPKGQPLDRNREDDFIQEIESQQSTNWTLTFEDFVDIITIFYVNEQEFYSLLGRGFVDNLKKKNPKMLMMLKIGCLAMSYLILVAYALVLYFIDDSSKMGIVISIAVTCMDFFNLVLYISRMVSNASSIIILLIINRIAMVILGASYWIYGFIGLYMLYALALLYIVARNTFPLADQVVLIKKINTRGIKNQMLKVKEIVKGINPVYLTILLTVLYLIFIIIIQYADFKGKEDLKDFYLMPNTKEQKKLEPIYACLFSILLVYSFYFFIGLGRLSIRKAKKLESKGAQSSKSWLQNSKVDLLTIYIIICFLASVTWGFIAFWATGMNNWPVWGTCGAGSVLCFLRAYVFFAMNDFEYFQDVKKLNAYIDRHNKKIDENEKKRLQIQQDLADGTLMLPPPEDPATNPQPPQHQPTNPSEANRPSIADEDLQNLENINKPGLPEGDSHPGNNEGDGQTEDQEAARARQEQAQREQQQKVQELIAKQKEEQKQREEEQRRKLEENQALRQQEEQQRREMEEQMRREKELAAEQQKKIEEENARKRQEIAEQQRQQQEERIQQERERMEQQDNYTYSGQAAQSDLINRNKAYKEDEIYEGGDEEAGQNQNTESTLYKSGEKLLNIDDEEKVEDFYKQLSKTKLRRVTDWRIKHNNKWFAALIARELRPNDMNFLISTFVGFILFCILGFVLLGVGDELRGAITIWPLLYIFICIMIGSAAIYQSRKFTIIEYVIWITINAIYLTIGIIFFIVQYEVKDFSYDLEKRTLKQENAAVFILVYVFSIPTLAHGLICALRIADRGMNKFWQDFKFFAISFAAGVVLMILCCFLFVHWIDGLIFLGAILFMIYVAAQLWMFVANDYLMRPLWSLVNQVLIIILVFFAFVWSAFDDSLTSFQGGSYSASVLLFFVWAYAVGSYFIDSQQSTHKPIYFSTSLFPVYQYRPQMGDVRPHGRSTMAFLLGFCLMFFWALVSNTQFYPQFWGPIFTIGIELLCLVYYMYVRQIQMNAVKVAFNGMTEEVAKSTWLQVKKQFVQSKGAFSRKSLKTYRRMTKRYFQVRNYINSIEDGLRPTVPNFLPNDLKREILPEQGVDAKIFYCEKIKMFMPEKYSVDNMQDMTTFLFELQEERFDSYQDELACFINFILISNQNSRLKQQLKQKEFLRFISEQKEILNALDINISIPSGNNIEHNYEMVQLQINDLEADKLGIFWQIHKLHLNKNQDAIKKREEVRAAEDDRRIRREQEAARESERKQEELRQLQERIQGESEIDLNQDIDSMVDSFYKYKVIVERSRKGGFPKFEDAQFPACAESIGDEVLANFSEEPQWKRMSYQDTPYCVFVDGVDATDIAQGMLGDCYLLSAFSVMGNDFTRDKFVFMHTSDEWKQTGAFCIRFYEDGIEEFVIVDDKLPVEGDGAFVFGQSTNNNELWPQILEKAYAKKYGSYSIIQGGHVHLALSELTNGVPRLILTAKEENLEKLWNELLAYHKEGAMLGAGSNSHEDGDSATSPLGIVQGHAFSILRLVEADGNKLMQIRNPWGRGEWIGDWSDDSDKWTTRLRNLVDWHESKDDGIFWMDINDYVTEFDSIYICRNFSDRNKWHYLEIDDEWKGVFTEGLPNKENPRASMEKNPQYGLTIHKPGHGIIVLRQKDKIDRHSAKQYIYFNMQALDGKLITRPNKSKQLGYSGPKNEVVSAVEVDFTGEHNYPYTFTFIVANMNHGPEGEGGYRVQMFLKDFDAKYEKLNSNIE